MARRSRDSGAACMFCEQRPCGCDGQALGIALAAGAVEAPQPCFLDQLTAHAEGKSLRYIMSDQEYATLAAVRCFANAFEIEGVGLDSYRSHLAEPASLSERAATWRYRHEQIPE